MKITSIPSVQSLLRTALEEDAGGGDITTLSTIPGDAVAHGRYIAKEDGVLCGMDIVRAVFDLLDADITLQAFLQEGRGFRKRTERSYRRESRPKSTPAYEWNRYRYR